MELLSIPKPREKSKAHLKALIYVYLLDKGFDVWIDVSSNALIRYTNGLKGYQKVRFDIVVYDGNKPLLVIGISPGNRRFTKTQFFGIPVIVLDHRKFNLSEIQREIMVKLSG